MASNTYIGVEGTVNYIVKDFTLEEVVDTLPEIKEVVYTVNDLTEVGGK